MIPITVIILTKDEAMHIGRAIGSVRDFAARIIVVDSGSTDDTIALARQAGAEVWSNPWTTHADQFNWALKQIAGQETWVLRLDADEIASAALVDRIADGLPQVAGIYVRRDIWFQGARVRYGGVSGLHTLRLFRNGKGKAEARWMDEHIVVSGQTTHWDAHIVDHNLKPLDWWIAKHNDYANREVMDLLVRPDAVPAVGPKRWIKDRVYRRLPAGGRALVYFLYRYVIRGGFRDAPSARQFHVLQGFWYRYLVDAKLAEARRLMRATHARPPQTLEALHDLSGRQSRKEAA